MGDPLEGASADQRAAFTAAYTALPQCPVGGLVVLARVVAGLLPPSLLPVVGLPVRSPMQAGPGRGGGRGGRSRRVVRSAGSEPMAYNQAVKASPEGQALAAWIEAHPGVAPGSNPEARQLLSSVNALRQRLRGQAAAGQGEARAEGPSPIDTGAGQTSTQGQASGN
jgi:hypothetical protein